MDAKDEIIFTGEYKDFKLGVRFEFDGDKNEDVASALAYISSQIEPHAFKFAGLDTKKIDDIAKVSGKGLDSIFKFFESTSPTAIKDSLEKAVTKKELLPAADSYLFKRLLENAGITFKIQPEPSLKPAQEQIGDVIGFIGKFGNWIAVKKLGLAKVQDYEVSGVLSSIDNTIVNKAFDFSGVNKNDALVDSVVKGKRKTYNNAVAALKELQPKLNGNQEDAYLICKVLEKVGYKPYASPEMLTNAHPDIKPPKVKGRKPKG